MVTPVRALACLALLVAGVAVAQTGPRAPASAASTTTAAVIHDALQGALRAQENPEAIAGGGWQEHADRLVEKETAARPELETMSAQGQASLRQALSEAAATLGLPDPVTPAQESQPAVAGGAPAAATHEPPLYRLYVSQSMGAAALKQAFAFSEITPRMDVVFRGVAKGQDIKQLQALIGKFYGHAPADGDPIPSIFIDPVAFEDNQVEVVPRLEKLDADGKPIAWVEGVMDPAWLETRLAAGDTGALGKFGTTLAIDEPDMLQQMQEQMAKYDAKAQAEKAMRDYWKHAQLTDLDVVTQTRVRSIDPTVTVPRDILTPDGTVLARQGDTYNPLEEIGFHQQLLVFDATDPKQLVFVDAYLKAHPNQRVTLITIRADRETGWEGWLANEQRFHQPLYLLNDPVRERFHIERVPTVVTAGGKVFYVTEVRPDNLDFAAGKSDPVAAAIARQPTHLHTNRGS